MSFPTTIYDSIAKAKETYASDVVGIPLGTRLIVPDGRVFRFAQAGATALVPFRLVKSAALGPWSTGSCSTIVVMGMATSYTAGATQIKFCYGATGTAVADYFKDGYAIWQNTDTANVQMGRIYSHPALQTATTLYTQSNSPNIINFGEPLDLAVPTATGCWPRLIPNPYRAAIVMDAAGSQGAILGVPITPVTASYFFWCQTWGPCAVLQDTGISDIGAKAAGYQVYAASGSTGGVGLGMTASASGYIAQDTDSGRAYQLGAVGTLMQSAFINTGFAMVNLRLAT